MLHYKLFESGDRTYQRAAQAWHILTAWVALGCKDPAGDFEFGLITYGTLGRLMGYEGPLVGRNAVRPVHNIYRFCAANELPLLSAIVIQKESGQPAWSCSPHVGGFDAAQQEVRRYGRKWFDIRIPKGATFQKFPRIDLEG